VYHVFGHLRNPDSIVLTEDDNFEYLIGVTKNNDMTARPTGPWSAS
jgi:hypothetical protein